MHFYVVIKQLKINTFSTRRKLGLFVVWQCNTMYTLKNNQYNLLCFHYKTNYKTTLNPNLKISICLDGTINTCYNVLRVAYASKIKTMSYDRRNRFVVNSRCKR